MKRKIKLYIGIISIMTIFTLPVSAKLVDVHKNYNVGTTYVAMSPSVATSNNGYTLSANTRPSKNDARLNISQDGTSVAVGIFPVQTARSPITATMYPNKVYKVHVRAVSGTASGSVHYYTNK